MNANPQYWKKAAELQPNAKSIYESELYGPLFNNPVPSSLEGFELSEKEKENMANFFPAGEDAAVQVSIQPWSLVIGHLLKDFILGLTTFPDDQGPYIAVRGSESFGSRRERKP